MRSISSFGLDDRNRAVAHDPHAGLRTIDSLIDEVLLTPEGVDDVEQVLDDLRETRAGLERACGRGGRFAFELEIGRSTQ